MYQISLGQTSPSIDEGIVSAWLKKEGESVQKGDCLARIESSQAVLEVKASISGILHKICVAAGMAIGTSDVLCYVGEKNEAVPEMPALKQKSEVRSQNSGVSLPPRGNQESAAAQGSEAQSLSTSPAVGIPEGVVPVLMPQAGQSIEEGTLLSWKVKEGDRIEVGQVILEIETDKATMEVEAVDAGRVARIVGQEGDIIEVKKPVAYLAESDADVDEYIRSQNSEVRTQEFVPPALGSETQSTTDSGAVPEGVVPVLMPQAGQSMEEGTLLSWKVKEGDRIEVGQVILEIETDKATMEVEAVDAGRVARIVAKEGDIIEVKKPVAYLAENDADVDEYIRIQNSEFRTQKIEDKKQVRSGEGPAPVTSPSVVQEGGRVKASPAARKLAQERNVDLASVTEGSGPRGRILSTDVASAQAASTGSGQAGLSKMRRAIARNLLYSKQNIPHFYAKVTVDAQRLFDTYQKTKTQFKCTINDFVTAACAKAVREFEPCRSQYRDETIKILPDVNIGIAVGTDDGLSVPVVLRVDTLSLQDLAIKTRKVVESARNGKHENVGQGVFTITNLGMFGVEDFQAIINPPESAILAVGAVREGVTVQDGNIKSTRLMAMTLSVDHRVIDGVVAAQFLARVKELLESPEQLI